MIFIFSFETDIVLKCIDSCAQEYITLLDLHLLINELANLLFEESHFINVHGLKFTEVFLEVCNILHDLFQGVIVLLSGLMFEGSQITSEKLRFLLILIETSVKVLYAIL